MGYIAMAYIICELIWFGSLLQDMHLFQKKPMKLYCDDKAVVYIVNSPVRTKHNEVNYHFIREKIESKEIITTFVRGVLTMSICLISY